MLKISEDSDGDAVVFVLEGSLTGPWVQEFERAWQSAVKRHCCRTRVNLSAVTFVSREGKDLLERLYVQGAELVSSDVLTRSILDAMATKHRLGREKQK